MHDLNDLLTTAEICAAANLTRNQLWTRARLYPDLVAPVRRIGATWMWNRSLVSHLIGMKLKTGRPRKLQLQGE